MIASWLRLGLLLGCLLAPLAPALFAQSWNGLAADDNFSSAANWSTGAAPVNDGTATVTFVGSTRTSPVLDTGYALDVLSIGATGFTLNGTQTLTLGSALQKTGSSYFDFTADVPIALANNIATGGAGTNGKITLNGVVSGDYGLTHSGSFGGNLHLAGENTFTGPLVVNSGTVKIGGDGSVAAGSIQADVVHGGSGSFYFTRKGDITYDGVISGTTSDIALGVTGSLSAADALTLRLTNQSTYSGQTSVGAATLVIGATNALPTSTLLYISSFGTVDVDHDQTVGNMGGGTGSLIDIASGVTFTANLSANSTTGGTSGAGNVVLTGAHNLQTYDEWEHTGTTTITDTNLIIGAGHGYGSLASDVVNNGRLTFNNSTAKTFAGDVSGSGVLTKQNTNTLTLTGAISNTGGIEIDAGTLNFAQSSTFTYAGDISGNGSLVLNGNDLQATFTGVVSTDLAITGSGAHATFDRDDNQTYSKVLSGTGQFTKAGAGTLTFDAAHTHSGVINLNEGGITASATDALGDTWINVADSTRLQIDADQHLRTINSTAGGDVTINNATVTVSRSTGIESALNGSGTLVYSTATGVLAGGGSFAGQVSTQGTSLHMAGTFESLDVLIGDGSTLSAGRATFSSSGYAGSADVQNMDFAAGSRLMIDIFNANGTAGVAWDHLTASGLVNFNGTSANPIDVIITGVNNAGNNAWVNDFDGTQNYSWNVVTGTSGITGFDVDAFNLTYSQFYNSYGLDFLGEFSLSLVSNSIFLNYTVASAVPEPSTYAALFGVVVLGVALRRRRAAARV